MARKVKMGKPSCNPKKLDNVYPWAWYQDRQGKEGHQAPISTQIGTHN